MTRCRDAIGFDVIDKDEMCRLVPKLCYRIVKVGVVLSRLDEDGSNKNVPCRGRLRTLDIAAARSLTHIRELRRDGEVFP